jgi:hypothetical protein
LITGEVALDEAISIARSHLQGPAPDPHWCLPLCYALWAQGNFREAFDVAQGHHSALANHLDFLNLFGMVARRVPGEDPAAEAALAFTIGDPNFVEAFLEKRTRATEELTKRIVHMTTVASASTPAVQSFSCLLRGCILQKVGHLLRIIPPTYTSGMATHLDQCITKATCALVGAEDAPDFQKELLTTPANCGGVEPPSPEPH